MLYYVPYCQFELRDDASVLVLSARRKLANNSSSNQHLDPYRKSEYRISIPLKFITFASIYCYHGFPTLLQPQKQPTLLDPSNFSSTCFYLQRKPRRTYGRPGGGKFGARYAFSHIDVLLFSSSGMRSTSLLRKRLHHEHPRSTVPTPFPPYVS